MHVTDQELDRFPRTAVGETAELAVARDAFTTWLHDVGLGAERIDELSVVFSELVSNAVRETPEDAQPAVVHAVAGDGDVTLEVTNAIDAHDRDGLAHDWDLDDPLRSGGRGLVLVSAFVDELDVELDDGRLVVRCRASA